MCTSASTVHAVFVPFPSQGHINPLLKLAKLLHHRGFHITFVNTEFNHRRLLRARGSQGLPGFCFETIPDGLPPSDADATQSIPAPCDSIRRNSLVPLKDLLEKLNDSGALGVPPVTCVVADGVAAFAIQAAEELGIPSVGFWTFSASGFLSLKLTADLMDKGVTPFKDSSYLTDGTLETPVDWIPGVKNIKLKHVARFIQTTDPNDLMLEYTKEQVDLSQKASALILYTFDDLETDFLSSLSPFFPPIYAIGPLQPLINQISDKNLESVDGSLWKQDDECIHWLDSKEPRSVIYVNFGSIAVPSTTEIQEVAAGLADSGKNFVWILRRDWLKGESEILPATFSDDVKGRGLILGWCNQEMVLNHPAIGGFFSHCGWNSVFEGIAAGVPFLCWPRATEQPMNSRMVCEEWRTGIQMGEELKRDDIVRCINQLLDDDEMSKRAFEWKNKAVQATTPPNGSCLLNLQKLIHHIRSG